MANNGQDIRDLYNEGIREVTKVIQQGEDEQVEVALKTLDDLTAMMLAHTIETVQGRTALLTGLIAELTQVVEAVQVDPPFADAANIFTGIIDKVRTSLEQEKKGLLATS